MRDFPVIDLSDFQAASPSAKRDIGKQVDEICRRTGFLAIAGHGISNQVITDAWSASRTFFDLPTDRKLEVKMPYVGYPYGYSPLQAEALAKSLGEETPPDLKESFSIGPLQQLPPGENDPDADFRYAANLWPTEPKEFRREWTTYYRTMSELAGRIMKIF